VISGHGASPCVSGDGLAVGVGEGEDVSAV
jgi:hypothetical protein